MSNRTQIAANLRAARARRRVTQAQAAEVIGVSVSTLRNWETAHTPVNTDALCELAALYDCDVGDLMAH